ncbi:MAG: phospholipid carrier-dependent glycosyltransferase [Candidatus Levybacteria bacterium]|nr:phospholipid carrier-dependent glycosyltransferase [Candidatus Levybacteria bacterium]
MEKIKRNGYILIFIFLIAVFLRLLGTNPGYSLAHADEQSTFGHVYNIIIKHSLEPGDFYYGPLLGYIYSIADITFFIPSLFQSFAIQNLYDYAIVQQRPILEFFDYFVATQLEKSWPLFDFNHNYLTYWGRYSTAVLSSFTVITIYFLGKNLFGNKKVGLIAAFLTAVNYRHVFSSTLLLADAPAALFASFSILLSVYVLKNKTMRNYLLAGTGLALAFSVKYFIYVLPAFLVCHIFSVWQSPKIRYFEKIKESVINKKFFLALIISVTLFLLIHPYLIIKTDTAMQQFKFNSLNYRIYSSSLDLSATNYSLYPAYYLWKYGLGATLSLVTIGGIFYGLIRYTKESIILLSAVIPFFYMFVGMAGRIGTVHNFSSIIPIILLFSALMIYKLGVLLPVSKKYSAFIIISLTLLIGLPSLKNSLISSYYSSKPPNSYVFANWQEENIPKDSKSILIDPAREEYLTIQDLKEREISWGIIDSNWNIILNDKWTKNNDIIKKTFFNEDLFWKTLNNTYLSLATQELGDYRVKEIVKPFWQPLDFAFFIIKVPKFWNIYKDTFIKRYDFAKNSTLKDWSINSFLSSKPNIKLSLNKQDSFGIKITAEECTLQSQILSEKIPVSENKWYTVSGLAKRKNHPTRNTRDGFLRLDFYSKENKNIKTYVSKQVNKTTWEEIISSGISPAHSKYARISFQIDNCFIKEEYYLGQVEFFTSGKSTKIDKSVYPYYGKAIPKNFIWAPIKYL